MKLDIKKFLKIMSPLPPVGGLEISDSAIRFMLLGDRNPITVALRLPPGIIEGGRLKNRNGLIGALREVHGKVGRRRKPLHVVLCLPAHLVYTQSFGIPFLPPDRIDESARLNLQMLSPMEFDKAYASWQKVGEKFAEGGQIELLGAFAERSVIDEFIAVLRDAAFIPVAVEFPSLSLSRVIGRGIPGGDAESYLLVNVASDGTSFAIYRNSNLHFNHFHSWGSIQEEFGGKQISADDFRTFLVREMQKVLNFYTGRWGGTVSHVISASSGVGNEIEKLVLENFGLSVKRITLKEFTNLEPAWFPCFGAALRGLVPRGDDTFISLTNESVQVQYREVRTINFIALWRNIAITALAFVLVVFGITDFFLSREIGRTGSRIPINETELAEVKRLEAAAKEFNLAVSSALAAKTQGIRWSKFLDTLGAVSAGRVKAEKITVDGTSITFNGSASDETSVLRFRDALDKVPNFSQVTLPLEGIRSNPDGSVEFTLSFRLKSLEF